MPAKKKPAAAPAVIPAPEQSPPLESATDPADFIAEYVALLRELTPAARDRFAASVISLPAPERARRVAADECDIKVRMAEMLASVDWRYHHALRVHLLQSPEEVVHRHAPDIEAFIEKQRQRELETVIETAKAIESSPEREAQRQALREEWRAKCGNPFPELPCSMEDAIRALVDPLKKISWPELQRQFREFMAPKDEARFNEAWFDPPINIWGSEERLQILLRKFLPHWRRQAAEAKAVSSINSVKGKSGVAKRERNKWLLFTQGFLAWTSRRTITKDLIKSYPKQEGIPETKGREFLGTLLNARDNLGTYKAMSETLAKTGIKLPPKHTEECFAVLFERKIPQR
jgi:hypothetical protein